MFEIAENVSCGLVEIVVEMFATVIVVVAGTVAVTRILCISNMSKDNIL